MTTSPIRIGLVGAGGISGAHLPSLLALGVEVTVFSQEGAEKLAARFGVTVADSLTELLDRVDWVDVVTPTFSHFEIVRRALEAGKDVICEKPLTRTDGESAELIELARSRGCLLIPAHVVRFFPQYVRLAEAVRSGRLGDLAVLRFYRSSAFPTASAWFGDFDRSGGIILDQMIHDIDIARWVAGEVRRVSATRTRRDDAGWPVEAAHVLLTHHSGAITHVAGVWGPPHLKFTTGFSVTGTDGHLEHDSWKEQATIMDLGDVADAGAFVPSFGAGPSDPYFLELREFLDSGPTRVSADDGAAAVKIANAANRSALTGQPVELDWRAER